MQTFTAMRSFVAQYPKTIALVTVTGAGLFGVQKWMAGGVCRSKASLEGKTVLITGGNTGIGKETAVDLAKRGARVILACRDMDRGNKAAEEVKKRSGNDNVIVKKLDLASLQSVRQLAKDVLASEGRLDVLINNAGVMSCPKWQTEDGFEMQFGVNHLGHFLLTNCLLDLLKKSASSRIITVSSLAHQRGSVFVCFYFTSRDVDWYSLSGMPSFSVSFDIKYHICECCFHSTGQIYFDDIHQEKDYHPWKSYAQSKLANVLFTRKLAKKLQGTGVTTYSLHPGIIRTELGRHFWPTMPLWKRVVYTPLMFLIKSPTEGAQTTIYCAVEESLQNESGLYYSDCAPKTAAPQGLDDEAAKKLWDLSASMVGLI
ncbi:retinol dehydrogenase 11-like isoform X1 [Anarrhichthys ocellatus]|uniref:retinol dehydrogenase 11-like isoform X1 n=1 Tax=Anarrhichthys ocellatus TaxID=433405 RepID=UPI0012ECF165|nr:retinol dehydrogenase 11-like isoform X1 [Anarrhichthys ocellatus]